MALPGPSILGLFSNCAVQLAKCCPNIGKPLLDQTQRQPAPRGMTTSPAETDVMADEHGSSQNREKKNYYQCDPHRFVVTAYARGFGTDRAF
jgi:hypothetical protein